ncbi:MAG: class I SAM-dependent methyltransferase [bacterium]|jgi:putative AdoMet-dependent methyltransferase
MTTPSWQYDEMTHTGKDFASREVVMAYDARHRQFRDVDKENEAIISGLDLQRHHTVAEFGCGTGAFAIQAAGKCARVYAVDISSAMLDYTGWKAEMQGLDNIVCCRGGFLTYMHEGEPLDAVVTSLALHHLPDFWKQKALHRLNGMLAGGGRLFIHDVVFAEDNYESNIKAWIDKLAKQVGPDMAADSARHVRCEDSTFTWIMEGLLARAEFRIDRVDYIDGVLAGYYCTKIA